MEFEQPTEYTTVEFLKNSVDEDRLIRWTDDTGKHQADPGIIEWAVLVANSQVHLSVKLPAGSEIPPALNLIANNFAKLLLAARRPPVDEDVQNDWNNSVMALQSIVTSGAIILSENVGDIAGDLTRDDIDDDLEGMANVIPLGDLSS